MSVCFEPGRKLTCMRGSQCIQSACNASTISNDSTRTRNSVTVNSHLTALTTHDSRPSSFEKGLDRLFKQARCENTNTNRASSLFLDAPRITGHCASPERPFHECRYQTNNHQVLMDSTTCAVSGQSGRRKMGQVG